MALRAWLGLLFLAQTVGAEVMVTPSTWADEPGYRAYAMAQKTFRVTNTGDQPVTVLSVNAPPAFDCDLPKKTIAAQQSVELFVNLTFPPAAAGRNRDLLQEVIVLRLDSEQDELRIPVQLEFASLDPSELRPSLGLQTDGRYQPRPGDQAVRLTVFYDSGCAACLGFYKSYLEPLAKHFEGSALELEMVDTESSRGIDNLERLLTMKDQYRIGGQPGKIFGFIGERAFLSSDQLEAELYDTILAELQHPTEPPLAPVRAAQDYGPSLPDESAAGAAPRTMRLFGDLSGPAVFAGGLVDGLNPCAFATAVFLIALLARLGHSRPTVIAAGTAFSLSVWVTYFLLGRGLLRSLELLGDRLLTVKLLNGAIAALSLYIAWLQLRDVYWLRAGIATRELSVQTPQTVKQWLHQLLRGGLSRPSAPAVAVGAALAGVAVTLLEAVCTGQIYLPVLQALATTPEVQGRVTALLAVYCTGFVVPLVVVVVLAVRGVSSAALAAWARRHLVAAKLGLAGLLVVLAGLLLANALR